MAVDHLGQRDSCASLARHVRPFFVYAANFGNFDATYGSLGPVIGFMTWMWISAIEVVVTAPASETATGAPRVVVGAHRAILVLTRGPKRPPRPRRPFQTLAAKAMRAVLAARNDARIASVGSRWRSPYENLPNPPSMKSSGRWRPKASLPFLLARTGSMSLNGTGSDASF